jgi:tetratricopeptide (TPR) repeat protein
VEQEDFDQAIADLDKALEIDPNLTEAWGNKAQALTGKGDVEGALDAFGRAIEASGGNPDLYFNRASLLYATGNFKEALADYRVAAKSSNEQLAWMAEQQVNFLKNVEEQPASTATPGGAATATAAAATP